MPEDTSDHPQPDLPAHAGAERWSELELLRVTLTSIGDGVITTDRHGRVTLINPVAQALTGWTQQEAFARDLTTVFTIINQETRREVENPALRALEQGIIVGLANHTLLISRDGTERPIDDSAAPIRDRDGTVGGAVLIFRDVTQRQQQEALTADALAFARAILATIRDPFLVLGHGLTVRSANRAFYRTFQVSQDQTEGRPIYALGNGQWNIPRLRTLLGQILPSDGTMEDFEVEHDFEEIGRRTMLLHARRLENSVPEHALILLGIEDVTQRRADEHQLRDSEKRYRRLFESTEDGILLLDIATGEVMDANPYVLRLTGFNLDDLRGRQLWEIGLFENVHDAKATQEQLKERGHLRYDHLPIRHRNGATTDAEFVCTVYHEGDRKVAQCNVRDISMRTRLAAADVRAEIMAQEARRKDEFLAMLSHELRNPLAPIRAAVHLLRSRERPGAEDLVQRRAHDIIERQVGNLTKIVSDLLEVSRVLTGRIHLDLQGVDLNQVISHAVETMRPLVDQCRHSLTVDTCPGEMWVHADPTRLEEVLINLLNNASKYTPEGGLIHVGCAAAPQADTAQVRVRDNGVGIAPELLPRIFDLFTQGERSLDRAAGGLGIGLSLAQRLVALHGGSITAHSPPDGQPQGAEFIITLPLVSPPQSSACGSAGQHPHAAGGKRVLLVDDNIDMVMVLAACLRQDGYSVETAYSGPDGLKVAQQWRPDVVIMDIGLPGMDGYEVARRLRADPLLASSQQTMRLIALTGYGRDADQDRAREAGFDGHLTKPVEFSVLAEMVGQGPGR